MNKSQVFELLEQHQNQRGIDNWHKLANSARLTSYGIGLTILRKLAKTIGRNHELAIQLWDTNNYDAKVLGLLIDEPNKLSEAQVESQVEGLNAGMLTHVFSSCDATLARAPFAFELSKKWLDHNDPIRRRCAYGLIYELSKKKNRQVSDKFYQSVIEKITLEFFQEPKSNRVSMGVALMGIGKRDKALNAQALKVAKEIGPIDFNEPGQNCAPMDIEKHLTSDYLKKRLGL